MKLCSFSLLLLFGCHAPEPNAYLTSKEQKDAQESYELARKCEFALAGKNGRVDVIIRHNGGWILCRK